MKELVMKFILGNLISIYRFPKKQNFINKIFLIVFILGNLISIYGFPNKQNFINKILLIVFILLGCECRG
jgi:hypothetical protein